MLDSFALCVPLGSLRRAVAGVPTAARLQRGVARSPVFSGRRGARYNIGMDAEQRAKIDAVLRECLDDCQGSRHPYTRLSTYFEGLKANPNWTPAEIIELQTRVIRILLHRQKNVGGQA
jgi:hypothetical protein